MNGKNDVWFKLDINSKDLLENYFDISEEKVDYLINYFSTIGFIDVCHKGE